MAYLLELSINLKKHVNLSEMKNKLFEKAEECKVERYYSVFEYMGENRQIYRNHCVLTFIFPEHDELLTAFIKFSKKFKSISVESLGYDNIIFKLMYASKKYLNMMDKGKVQQYIKDFKSKSLYRQDSLPVRAILKKN